MAYFDLSSPIEEDFDDQTNDEDFLIALQLQNQFDKEKENGEHLNKITQVRHKVFEVLSKKSLIF